MLRLLLVGLACVLGVVSRTDRARALESGDPSFVAQMRPTPGLGFERPTSLTAGDSEAACDDGSAGGTLIQQIDAYYGNRFASACTAARIQSASFAHFGYGLQGPYAFRLHLLDADCGEIGATPVLTTAGAPDSVTTAAVDLLRFGWCVAGDFHLLLEPLTCADGATGRDCFPAVVVDATADGDAGSHCATVSLQNGPQRQCFAARSADGRYFDFGLRVQLSCSGTECTSAVERSSWSGVKRLYRDPEAATRD